MIATVEGLVSYLEEQAVVITVGGIGVRVSAPRDVLSDAVVGRRILLQTHLVVRETELTLYGFNTKDELRLFELLLTVSGVGPKLALTILSTLTPEMLRAAVVQEETAILQRVPGIGKKTAQRLLFALKDKIDVGSSAAVPLVSDTDADVIDVLTALGFSVVESQAALQRLPREVRDVEARVALALQYLDASR